MKIQIRNSVFETNSSSVHTVSICSKTEYDKWIKNELKFNIGDEKFLPNCEADGFNKKYLEEIGRSDDELSIYDKKYMYITYSEYLDMTDYFETFEKSYKDDIVCFGYFGYDG